VTAPAPDFSRLPVSPDDVRAARDVVSAIARVTPIETSRALSEFLGRPVELKCENLQRAGSFKVRGAYHRIARLDAAERAAGVVAASAGNHAQGVALAADALGVDAVVFMPHGAPLPKVAATRAYGADVHFAGDTVDEALEAAEKHASETGAVLVHPFDHRDVVAGQGTVGLELLDQCPELSTVVVPVGGGGLLAGMALAIRSVRPDVRIIGVQAAGAAAYPQSLRSHRPRSVDVMSTIADGIAVGQPGAVPFAVIDALVDDVLTVTEESLSRAVLLCLERAKLVVEPAGAAAVAAMLEHPDALRGGAGRSGSGSGSVVGVLSGGNVDPVLLIRQLRHGMSAAGRYLVLRVRVDDRPGALAALLDDIARTQANVLEIEHVRTDPQLGVDEVAVVVQLETRGPDHCADVLAHLRSEGWTVHGGGQLDRSAPPT
jgi:threonine dehydratase